MRTREYTIPSFYLSALINSDMSGLNDNDESALNEFVDSELKDNKMFHCLSDTEDMGFMTYHDLQPFGVLACDCSRVVFQVE